MFAKKFVTLILCVLPVLGAPSPLVPLTKTEDAVAGQYIVIFKDGVTHPTGISSVTSKISSQSKITHDWTIINGFAGTFSDADLEALRANPNVKSIGQGGRAHTQAITTQTDATWALGRISSKTKLDNQEFNATTFSYNYDSTGGANSDVYVIDTGILTSHPAFEGRASWGATFGNYSDTDVFGHGTFCAGLAASAPYGVAKSAKIIAVRVMDDFGNGDWADVISGMEWVAGAAKSSGRPSVASISITGFFQGYVNDATAKLVSSGVPTVVAAGNNYGDAINYSPASVPSVITVGASTIADERADFSNYGTVVDIWAPGKDIISTSNDGLNATHDGTSAATPIVAGYAAYLLTLDSSLTPDTVDATIKSNSLKDVITGIPKGTNALLNNGL